MGQRIWRLGSSPQPLVFRFAGVSTLCAAVAALYRRCPPAKAWLCLYRGRYYLACGGKNRVYSSGEARNEHYRRFCCRCYGQCTIYTTMKGALEENAQ